MGVFADFSFGFISPDLDGSNYGAMVISISKDRVGTVAKGLPDVGIPSLRQSRAKLCLVVGKMLFMSKNMR